MRRLTLLKNIVDFIWIISCIPAIFVMLIFSVYMFFDPEILQFMDFDFKEGIINVWSLRVFVLFMIILIVLVIYSFYLFRKSLRYYQKRKPFDSYVIDSYSKIGKLLVAVGVLGGVGSFIFDLVFKNKLLINFGISPYLLIACLGLFFMVLSETFIIAKHSKEDSDLTI